MRGGGQSIVMTCIKIRATQFAKIAFTHVNCPSCRPESVLSASPAARPAIAASKRAAFTTIGLVIFCQSFQALTYGGIALFLPLIRADLHMTFSQAGMLSAASTFTYMLGQVPSGYLADRFGPKRLFFFGVFGSTALALNFAFIETFEFAVANQLVSGVFRALLFAPGLALISSWFPPERRATAMGLYVAGGFSGNIFLSLAGPLMVNHYGWRFPFIMFSVMGMGASFLYLAFGREKPRTEPRHPPGLAHAAELLRHRFMWLCAAVQFIRMGPVVGFNFWLPSFLVADRGLTIQAAGLVTAMGAALSAPSNALGGYVSDRLRNPPLVIGGSLTVLACTSLLLVHVHSMPLLLLVIAVNSVFAQFYFGPLFMVPVEVLGTRTAGLSTGFSNLFANAGSLGFAYTLGAIKDHSGSFTWGFSAVGATCALGVVLSVALARLRRRALAAKAL